MKNVQSLKEALDLKKISENVFEGTSSSIGTSHVYGGQVFAQSLLAMYHTMSANRYCHSMHSYFLEAGDLEIPIRFEVEHLRDGGSFSTRRVTALQEGTIIFVATGSFQLEREGLSHQVDMPIVKQPEELISWTEMGKQLKGFLPKSIEHFLSIERPMEFKPVEFHNPLEEKDYEPYKDVWFKVKGSTNDLSKQWSQIVLAYISDYNVLTTTLNPHASHANFNNTKLASLDHSLWFHQDFNLNDWILFHIESPIAKNERGIASGKIFTKDGKLIASAVQEGLLRKKQ